VKEALLNHHGSFDAGDELGVAAAAVADVDVEVEHPLQVRCPRRG